MLTWFKRLIGKAPTMSGVRYGLAGVPLTELGTYESYLRAGTKKVWAAWKACDITANSVSNTPWSLVRVGEKPVPVTVPDLSRLFEYVNENMTFRELIYLTVAHAKLTGSAFWFKGETNVMGDKPRTLFPLNPKRITIIPDQTTGEVQRYVYKSDGESMDLMPNDVMHFKRPHPNNDFWGLGDMEAGEDLFQEHINANTWKKKFWENGATPSQIMIWEIEGTPDPENWKQLKKTFEAEYSGKENAGKTAWLAGKWRREQLGLTAAQMENLESSKWNVEQIFTQMGVPLSVAGLRDAANYATADIDNQRFKEYSILPLVLMIQDTVNTDLVAGWRQNLKFRFDVSGLINIGKLVADLAPGFDRGYFSINEVRGMLKLEQDPTNELWTQHFINAGLVPLDLSGVADLQQVDQQAQGVVTRFVTEALATKRNEPKPKP